MALAPVRPAPPHAVPPQDPAAVLAENNKAHAKRLEGHIDVYLRAQKLQPGAAVEVSIGERDSIDPAVLADLCKLYRDAGWSKATTAQDIETPPAVGHPEGEQIASGLMPDPRGIVLYLTP